MKWKTKAILGLSFLTTFFSRYNFWRKKEIGVSVLLYHRLSKQKTYTNLDKFSIDSKNFYYHMDYLKQMGYKTVNVENLEECEKSPVFSFSYPYGAWDDESKKTVKEYYKKALVIKQKTYIKNDDAFLVPRAVMRKNTDMVDFYLLLTRGRSRI
jgi:hypothetical protein